MLRIPDRGMDRSVNSHNCSLSVVSDWIEASLLFDRTCERITRAEVIDELIDAKAYAEQDYADEFLVDIWKELARRARRIKLSCPFEIRGKTIFRKKEWKNVPAHAFFMALSMLDLYGKDLHGPLGSSHAEQGELFEKIAECSLSRMGWTVLRTGWAGGQANLKLDDVVRQVSSHLNETNIHSGIISTYRNRNDLGLDLVLSRPFFEDNRVGRPIYLVQCASGSNEFEKRGTPDVVLWSKMIAFSSNPTKAFAVPFSYEDRAFFRLCCDVNGMVLDRYRLLSAGQNGKAWMPADLKKRLVVTIKNRLGDVERLRVSR